MIPLILIRKSLLSLLTAVSLGGLFLLLQTSSQAAAAPAVIQANGITRQQTSADSLSFTLVTPADPTAQANLETSGLNALIHEPGAPELPYFTTLIALPPAAEIHVTVTARGETAVANTYVPPAAQPTLANIDPANADFLPETAVLPQTAGERIPDDAIYQSDSRYPQTRYQVSQPMYYRDIRLVRLELFPIQYNPLKQERYHAAQLDVDITFNGGSLDSLHPAPSANDAYQQTAASLILNFEQAQNWRSLPQNEGGMVETAVPLPTDRTSYKIELNQNGIYEITGADLAAAGMNITNTNPSTLQMMSRGESVAYQLIDNGDNKLDPTDVIRFYGEAIHTSRREKQFLSTNVYWLWADGSATPIPTENNDTSGETATSFLESITREDENGFTSTYNNQWPAFPNEPDSWGWQLVRRNGAVLANPLTRLPNEMPTLNLPDPALNSGTTVTATVEMIPYNLGNGPYQVTVCINSHPACGSLTWSGIKNVNITNTAPITALVNGVNTIHVDLSNPPGYTNDLRYYINRITVEYLRALKASDNQLIFTDAMGGRAMVVEGFSTNNPAQFLIWDITTPKQPVALEIESGDISGAPGSYTLTLGRDSAGAQQYIATTLANTLSGSETVTISAYTPPANLEPAAGADWIAISHANFRTQADTLAAHRANSLYGGLKTHVIDIEDVVNVYGFGLNMPEAINAYLKDALSTWSTPPSYVVLLGDATLNPRNLDCSTVTQNGLRFCSVWDKDAKTFIPTDMMFTDRFQGLIPSDQTAVLLAGDDILPDMAIGRLPANNAEQANNMVSKIIRYEQNQLSTQPNYAWQKNVLFLADDADAGGNFCLTNQTITGPLLPASFPQEHLCLDNYTDGVETAEKQMRIDTGTALAGGVSLMNYRGHGSIQYWGGNPKILDSTSAADIEDVWKNPGKPVVLISADCLDGHFAYPGRIALSEIFLGLGEVGTASNWSSSGLGYDNEHTALLHGFYTGLFDEGHTAIGDAINHAKMYYYTGNYHDEEIYSFNLQGDPAMQLYRPEVSLDLDANPSHVMIDDPVAFTLTAANSGFYPDRATITVTLPAGLSYVSASSAAAHTVTVNGNQVVLKLEDAIMQGETAVITLQTTANGAESGTITTTANLTTSGLNLTTGNQSASADVTIHLFNAYLPMIKK
jgi:hypothetical protein